MEAANKKVSLGLVVLIIFVLGILAGGGIYRSIHNNSVDIAPSYALDSGCTQYGKHIPCYDNEPKPFLTFWKDTTKGTYFTRNGEPVEITDIQVFYKAINYHCPSEPYSCCPIDFGGSIRLKCGCCYTYGNITYYPMGIENSQTYVPTPTPSSCAFLMCERGLEDCQKISGPCDFNDDHWKIPVSTPTPAMTPAIEISIELYNSQGGNWTSLVE